MTRSRLSRAAATVTVFGRCLRPALSSLRDGAAVGVSTLRASIAIAAACDISDRNGRNAMRAGMVAVPFLAVLAWDENTIAGWALFAYAVAGILLAGVLVRAVEFWRTAWLRMLDIAKAEAALAQGGEAEGRDASSRLGAEHEHPVAEGDAP